MRLTARAKALLYVTGTAIVFVGIAVGIWQMTRPHYVLTAKYVTNPPKADGKASDSAWKKAVELVIPIKDGPEVTLKSVYTTDKVFFLARYKDASKDAIHMPWIYGENGWKKGRPSDACILFFDIEHSIADFETKGFGVMDFGFAANNDYNEFGQFGKRQSNGYWPGYKAKGDMWIAGPAFSSPYGMCEDNVWQVNRGYLLSPTMVNPVISVQFDEFNNTRMLMLNINKWQEATKVEADETVIAVKKEAPFLKYQEGLNLNNTPYPLDTQLEPIADDAVFKPGDELPLIYYNSVLAGHWGGSRDDIEGTMKWANGWWTVEMARNLNTGYQDDIRFDPSATESTPFGILVRTDGKIVRYGVPAELTFGAKGGN